MEHQKHRLVQGKYYMGDSRNFIGIIRDWRIHVGNKRVMVNLYFHNADHQKLWGGSWLYTDDLEEVE